MSQGTKISLGFLALCLGLLIIFMAKHATASRRFNDTQHHHLTVDRRHQELWHDLQGIRRRLVAARAPLRLARYHRSYPSMTRAPSVCNRCNDNGNSFARPCWRTTARLSSKTSAVSASTGQPSAGCSGRSCRPIASAVAVIRLFLAT
jgi:hypothetical protein